MNIIYSLKLTAKTPENGWLEDYFPFEKVYFQGAILVLGMVSSYVEIIRSHYKDPYEPISISWNVISGFERSSSEILQLWDDLNSGQILKGKNPVVKPSFTKKKWGYTWFKPWKNRR